MSDHVSNLLAIELGAAQVIAPRTLALFQPPPTTEYSAVALETPSAYDPRDHSELEHPPTSQEQSLPASLPAPAVSRRATVVTPRTREHSARASPSSWNDPNADGVTAHSHPEFRHDDAIEAPGMPIARRPAGRVEHPDPPATLRERTQSKIPIHPQAERTTRGEQELVARRRGERHETDNTVEPHGGVTLVRAATAMAESARPLSDGTVTLPPERMLTDGGSPIAGAAGNEPAVVVTIGRVEVRATPAQAPRGPAAAGRSPGVTLDHYLRRGGNA